MAGEKAFTSSIGVAISPSTAPYPLAPNSASGTAPRTIVMTPCEAPNRSVKATSCHRSPRANKSRISEAGTHSDGDARNGHRLEVAAEEYLDESAGELAMPLEGGDPDRRCPGEARRLEQRHELQRDHAENEAVERHDECEKDNADDAHAPFEHRARPLQSLQSCAATVSSLASRRARPIQLSGRQIARLIAAKIMSVPRQP